MAASPIDPLALLEADVPPDALAAARAAVLRRQLAQRPATAQETAALGAIGPVAALAQPMALAEALRNRQLETGAYGLFGGDNEGEVRSRAEGMNYGLRGQRAAGNLGLLTGDRVLSGFGRAQLQVADRQEAMLAEAGQFRAGNVLKAALAAEEAKRADMREKQAAAEREADRKNRLQAAAIQSGDKTLQQKMENETGLRKEFFALPAVKEFADTETNYQTIQDAIGDTSGMGATTLVFSIMKMLDPGVSVMQGDVDLIRQSGGKAAQWANIYESALKGNPLSPKVRADILRQAETLYRNRKAKVDELATKYGILAEDVGVNPRRVLLRFDDDKAENGPQRTNPSSAMPTGPDGNPTLDAGSAAPAQTPTPKAASKYRDVSVAGMKPGDLSKALQEGETVRIRQTGKVVRKKGGKLVVVTE